MNEFLRGKLLSREEMPAGLVDIERLQLVDVQLQELCHISIPPRGAFMGKWNTETSDPFPEIIVVNSNDHADTIAWISSYFPNMSPITQWCRIFNQRQLLDTFENTTTISLHGRVGPWVGAILAECSTQGMNTLNLRDLSGNATLSTASYTAARSFAVRGYFPDYSELARRHDELTLIFRDGSRPLSAQSLVPLWSAISNTKDFVERRAIEPFARIIDYLCASNSTEISDNVRSVLDQTQKTFDIPELFSCAKGTQADRVRSLDMLADRLSSDPRTIAIEAIMGLGASLVDPGVAVMPELLKKYSERFPTASIWMGAFAGALSPAKVLTDFGGLGRLVLKSVLSESDLFTRPEGDVAYEELMRWVVPNKPFPTASIRAMAVRSLNVELLLGVTGSFSLARGETNSQRDIRNENNSTSKRQVSPEPATSSLTELIRRIERLEQAVSSRSSYLPGLDPQEDATNKRNASRPKNKR